MYWNKIGVRENEKYSFMKFFSSSKNLEQKRMKHVKKMKKRLKNIQLFVSFFNRKISLRFHVIFL